MTADSTSSTKHTGRCLCGAVHYEFETPAKWVGYCHCQSCRRNTGAPVAAFVGVPSRQFRYVRGAPVRFESSARTWRSFCGACGSPLTYESARWVDEIHINMGTLDAPQAFQPTFHVHVAERVPWFETADTLPRFAGTSSGGGA